MVWDRSNGVAASLLAKPPHCFCPIALLGAKDWPWFSYYIQVENVYDCFHSSWGNRPWISSFVFLPWQRSSCLALLRWLNANVRSMYPHTTIHWKYPLCRNSTKWSVKKKETGAHIIMLLGLLTHALRTYKEYKRILRILRIICWNWTFKRKSWCDYHFCRCSDRTLSKSDQWV